MGSWKVSTALGACNRKTAHRYVGKCLGGSISQGKRYAERWCAARLYPELRLRAAVARLLDAKPAEPLELLPGLPPTREQQQARRLAEAGLKELERMKEALGHLSLKVGMGSAFSSKRVNG